MSLDVGLSLPGNKVARPGIWTVAPWHAVVAVFMLAIMLRAVLPFNVDVSWWLIVCERMLDGQRLYLDILETNPPMAGAVYMVGVALARAVHVRPEVVTNTLIFALVAVSLALAWRALRFSSLRERAGGAAAVWAAALLTILPMYDFGQREHLALVAMLPALAVYLLRANRETVAPSAILIAGLCAATTMSGHADRTPEAVQELRQAVIQSKLDLSERDETTMNGQRIMTSARATSRGIAGRRCRMAIRSFWPA